MRSMIRGDAGEALVLATLVQAGCTVLQPFSSGLAYDLGIATDDGRLIRVQCKTAWRNGECLEFNSASTDHGHGNLSYVGRADVFGVADLDTSTVYLVPVAEAVTRMTRLRLHPTRNNQRLRVRMAADYTIERRLEDVLAA